MGQIEAVEVIVDWIKEHTKPISTKEIVSSQNQSETTETNWIVNSPRHTNTYT